MIKNKKIWFIFFWVVNFSLAKSFIFSVIIAIFNTAKYLDDSLGSVLNQTIGIKNIQIILINDGSIDDTEEKCLKYKEKYKSNIIYIKIAHSGVSIARNIGLKYAKGKYINFLDSDDKWDKNAFHHVFLFFKFYKNINIIGCRLKFFEASDNYHPLDYKFYKSRAANLTEEYKCIHLMSSSSFFRYSLIKGHKFKEGIFTGEDTRFINNFLLLKPLIGFIREAIYFYRKRLDSTSAVQNAFKNEGFYFSIINLVDEYLIEKSKKLYNRILPFIQFYLGYNILFRISSPVYKYLEKNKLYKYYEKIQKIINQIEDKYILEQKILTLKEKFVILSKKYHHDLRNDILIKNESIIYSGNILMNIKHNKWILIWRFLEIKNNKIHLEGKDNCILKSNTFFYFCRLGKKIYYPKYFHYSNYDLVTIYGNMNKGRMVVFNIPLEKMNCQVLEFFLSYNGQIIEIFPSLGWFVPIPNINDGYYISLGNIIKYIDGRLHIYQNNETLKESFEKQYCEQLRKIKKQNILEIRKKYFQKEKSRKNNTTEIWIINDKQNIARDNGEFFFRFLTKKRPKKIEFYFAIKKDCSDYNRLKQLGNILELGNKNYLYLFLTANKIISSVSESWVYNPFGKERNFFIDLFHFDFIFIQHGIIKDDLSKFYNRIVKNISLIISSSMKEYKSIISYKYHYHKHNVILSGLPRYDNLYRFQSFINKENIVLIIPTWRMYIRGTFDINTYESIYSYSFNLTKYFNFYNSLINDDQLLMNMKKLNYKGIFCLHPYFSKQWKDFKQNEIFSTREICDYQNLILKSSLLITDYSSIFFDFAFLKKPIIYTQFDYEEYRNYHYQKDYFDYFRNGFGPICFDYNCTINKIIKIIKYNCSIENKYLKRIKGFFKYTDDNNCERLYSILLRRSVSTIKVNKSYNLFINMLFLLYIIIKLIVKIKENKYFNFKYQ